MIKWEIESFIFLKQKQTDSLLNTVVVISNLLYSVIEYLICLFSLKNGNIA